MQLNSHHTWAGLGGPFSRIDHKGGSAYHCACAQCIPAIECVDIRAIKSEGDAKMAGFTRLVYAECTMHDGVYLIRYDADLDDVVHAWCDDAQRVVKLNGWNWTFEDA